MPIIKQRPRVREAAMLRRTEGAPRATDRSIVPLRHRLPASYLAADHWLRQAEGFREAIAAGAHYDVAVDDAFASTI